MRLKDELSNYFSERANFINIILIILVGFGIYANTLDGQFIWDDEYLVRYNIYIKDWSYAKKIFTEDIGAGGDKPFRYYRPLHIFTYLIDYSMWRLDVFGYHFTNIVLHILVVLSIYYFIAILYNNRFLSLLTSLLFLTHPIQTETVASISVRGDSLCALFMLLCFISYIKLLDEYQPGFYILMLLSFILALLSKESSLILPALLLLYHCSFKKKLSFRIFIPLIMIAGIYIFLRTEILKSVPFEKYWIWTSPKRIPGFFIAIMNYIRLLILPFGLHAEYGYKWVNFLNPQVIFGVFITSSLVIYAFKKRKDNTLVFFSIFWFFIALLPVSNIYPVGFYMAEHYLYLPSLGFFLILAKGFKYLYKSKNFKKIAPIFIVILIASYSYLTIKQNNYWQEPMTFYERTLKYMPNSARINNNLGGKYNSLGMYDKAIELLENALKAEKCYAEIYINLGFAYAAIGKKEEAIKLYKKCIIVNFRYKEAYLKLANLYDEMGNKEDAIRLYEEVLKIFPDYTDAWYNLAVTYDSIGMQQRAIELYKKTIEVNPRYTPAYNNLGVIYQDTNRFVEAGELFMKIIEIDPNSASAYNNLGMICVYIGKPEYAIDLYKKAVEMDPGYADAYNNLGITYKNMEMIEDAIMSLEKAIQLESSHAKAYNNLGIIMYRKKQNKDKAISLFKKTLEIDPSHVEAYNNLGIIYRESGMIEDAIGMYKKAIQIEPNNTEVCNNLALAYTDIGKDGEAIELFKKILEINPNHAMAHHNLALSYFRNKQYDKAIGHYDKAEELGFSNPDFLELLKPYRK